MAPTWRPTAKPEGLIQLFVARAALPVGLTHDGQHEFYGSLGDLLPTVKLSVQTLESRTYTWTATREVLGDAVALLRKATINDEPTDAYTVKAMQLLGQTDQALPSLRAMCGVLATVNSHNFINELGMT
mmetsp:Transcript_117093/g.372859  ORF Transcript_117093/g.372859 Transcript_117093/m.372859 type:complete len:129 (-) Transcript_117093:1012-1398(-)